MDIRDYLLARKTGGPGVDIQSLSVSSNNTYTAPEGVAYSPVVVDVPNSYKADDEGKVVSNAALVAQTSITVTQNGTVDTTTNNSVTVDVQPMLQEKTATENGDVMPDTGYDGLSKVTVNVSGGSGGSSAQRKAVNFIDSYDGTIAYSYTAAEFANLTALPENPSHDGMTAQGWNMPSNWTLSDAKTYVAANGKADWGQMYTTDDGKTRVYIHLEEGRTSPMLGCCPNGTVDVDWGDGTAHDTLTGTSVTKVQWTPTHNYADPGDYVIKLSVTGSMGLYGSSTSNQYSGLLRYSSSSDTRNYVYRNVIRRVEIGNSVTSIGGSAFYYCYSLTFVTIPSSVTSIGGSAFYYCYSLTSVTIPSSVTSIGSNVFSNCYSLTSVTIPSSVTSIGSNVFSNCYSLTSVTIPSSVTSIDSYAFYYCYSLTSVTIPSSVTSIGSNAFSTCYSLTSVTIPSSLTSIDSGAFSGCCSLTSVTIPSSVTSIGSGAFYNYYGLAALHFKPTTPPAVSNSNTFAGIPADCKIYVPTGKKSAYTSANNYPSSSTYTYVEE